MKSNETSAPAVVGLCTDQWEKTLLENRAERMIIERISFRLEGDWVDHKKVLKIVQGILGPEALKGISKQPKVYFDKCSAIMYREKDNSLQVSTKGMEEEYFIELHDREAELASKISEMQKTERSLKRKREKEVCKREKEKRSKTATGGNSESDGAHIKSFKLEGCTGFFADPEFAIEMGVMNKGVGIKLDLTSMRSESVRMIFPLKCWVNSEEMPLSPDEVRKYGIENMSDEESDLENEKSETNTALDNDVAVGTSITFNLCRVYSRKNAKSKYEIGTLHIGNRVKYSIEQSGGGWFKVLAPIPGWIQYTELSLPELTKQEQDKLAKHEKAKEMAIDLSTGGAVLNKASMGIESEKGKNDKTVDDLKSSKTQKKETTIGKTTEKNSKKAQKKETASSMDEAQKELSESDEVEEPKESDNDEQCTDDDWDEFEDPDEETLSGNWSCGQKGGCFTLIQKDDGVLDGFLESKKTCAIDGKVDGDEVVFNQIWQKGSLQGIGVVTVVKGTHSDGMRTMDVKFECTNKKGKVITGKNMLFKEPATDISGIWYAQDMKLGFFAFKMSEKGKIAGFADSENSCKISGMMSAHHIRFRQIWQVKPFKKSGFTQKFLITSVEGFVNDSGSKMCLTYTHPKPDGTEVSGNVVLRKKTAYALAGLWVSGDQGGRFIFQENGGQNFIGYLDTDAECRFQEGVIKGFSISFRQVWLSGPHEGAIAQVKGKANEMFTKLELTYSCQKKAGNAIKGKSLLSKLTGTSDSKEIVLNNGCFSGIHSRFPPNVFKQFQGFKMFAHHTGENRFPVYTRTQKILILGEADFSFTLAMMRAFKRSFSTIIGTSYMRKWGHGKPPPSWNSDPKKRQFLNESVRKLEPTLNEIVERGGYCRFGVDARDLEKTLYSKDHAGKWCGKLSKMKFDRVIFPFPRASLNRFDRVDDTDLMRGTFRSAQKMLNPTGELHIIMHTSREGVAQLDRWNIRDLAEEENLVWRAALPFDPKKMPAYNPKDVTGTPWRPYEPRIHVFTPINSEWRPEYRSWRH